jgi:hypothetical protein
VKLTGDRCVCRTCGERFNSTRAFDKHRIGDWGMRRCRTPDVMEAIGMSRNARGLWITQIFKSQPPRKGETQEISESGTSVATSSSACETDLSG